MASELHTSSINVKLAAPPFNDENADIILRSSDGIHFYAHKMILSIASSFFRDMFSLPEPVTSERQTVDMTEDSSTLDAMLRLCYPVRDPPMNEWVSAVNILEAVTKYQMNEAIELVTNSIKAFIPASPLAVYGLACHPNINSEELARLAAQAWIDQESEWVSLYSKEHGIYSGPYFIFNQWENTSFSKSYNSQYSQTTTAGQWYRLLRSLRTKTLPDKFLVKEDPIKETSPAKPRSHPTSDSESDNQSSHGDIIIRSSDGYDFCTHRIILQIASPNLFKSLTPMDGGRVHEYDSELSSVPVYSLPEHSSTIRKVLEICDPSASDVSVEVGDSDLWQGVLQMATRYDIPKAVSFGKLWCTYLIKENPLRSYYTAVRYGWDELARQSSKATLFSSIENAYTSEMEYASARSYYNLMKYHHYFQHDFSDILVRYSPTARPPPRDTLFLTWKVKDVEDHSFNLQWNDELTAVFSYITHISLRGSDFNGNEFAKLFDSFTTELKSILKDIMLEI